jgi:hypothetical protein
VEGDDDQRFFQSVVKPLMEIKYDDVEIIMYQKEPPKRIKNYITSFEGMKADYIIISDINNKPCIREKKKYVTKLIKHNIDHTNIIIVKKEIESWYAAGINPIHRRTYGMSDVVTTDELTKEQFNKYKPKKLERVEFLQEILKNFDVPIGKERNSSLRYFFNKWKIS